VRPATDCHRKLRLRSSVSTLLCRLHRGKETGRYRESFALRSVTIHWPPRVVIVIPLTRWVARLVAAFLQCPSARPPARRPARQAVRVRSVSVSTAPPQCLPACTPNDYVIIYYAHVICRRCPAVSTCSCSSRRCHRHRHRHQQQQQQLKLGYNDNSESNGQRRFTSIYHKLCVRDPVQSDAFIPHPALSHQGLVACSADSGLTGCGDAICDVGGLTSAPVN